MGPIVGIEALATTWRKCRRSGLTALQLALPLLALPLAGCSLDGLLKSDQLPPNVSDPAVVKTAEGALAAYRGLLAQFRVTFGGGNSNSYIATSGLLSDELLKDHGSNPVDRRLVPEGSEDSRTEATYRLLHLVRADAGQAIGLLHDFRPADSALIGHAYALEGYAEVFLAELYCSGIPLSTVDYNGDYTYRAGSSTAEVFAHAGALFDSALALSQDSLGFVYLATLGKARALLGLGDYAGAAAAVAAIPDAYRDTVNYAPGADSTNGTNFVTSVADGEYGSADQEGSTGLAYRTSDDPRTTPMRAVVVSGLSGSFTLYIPEKYAADGSTPLVLASGIEARLIEAEAALRTDPSGTSTAWLDKLNALRTDGTQDGTTGAYNPGSGGVAGLAPLSDPGTASGRVDLLFRERAFWLYLTGHRQGDLRRLERAVERGGYGRPESSVYPIGTYLPAGTFGVQYGSDVNLPVPPAEQTSNPLFTGCQSRSE